MKRRIGSFFYKMSPKKQDVAKARWNVWRILGGALKKTCMAIGAMILFSVFASLILVFVVGGKAMAPSLPDDMILVLNIVDPIGEVENARSFSDPLAPAGLTVSDLVKTLDTASIDRRVRGILVSLDNGGIELTHVQELRAAVKRFRLSGKFAHIYTSSFSDLGSGIGAYYFASAFDQIWMQPVGFLSITGISMEMPFARALLDKLGAMPEFLHREEYKSAMESFTHDKMTGPSREMMTSILEDISQQVFKDIVNDKKVSAQTLKANMDKGLVTGADALKAGLISRLDYSDVLLDEVQKNIPNKKGDEDLPLVDLENYFIAMDEYSPEKGSKAVALVHISGEIVPGADPEPGYANGDYLANAIAEAAEDEDIKAIVLRVDSPGGSPTASETIRRSIVKAKESGKKIIVSMGPVAASGGYWVTVDADKIFALPSTLTGSIGVIMGKFELSKLWEKLGVHWDGLTWGENARIWSMNAPMSENEKNALNVAIDDTYAAFIKRVAEGRKMDVEKVRSLAKGRAWTGAQAKKNGLVDEIGGLDVAMDYTASLLDLRDRSMLDVRIIPEPLTPIEELLHLMGEQVSFNGGFGSALFGSFFAPTMKRIETINRSGLMQTYDPDLRVRP